jgi:site-specific DNA-methyltransferase (cytosine-N4-specific)
LGSGAFGTVFLAKYNQNGFSLIIDKFYAIKINKLMSLKLNEILHRKNPYLFKAKDILIHTDLIKEILDAYLSSSEETIFGKLLEDLAIFTNSKVYGGKKAKENKFKSVDLIFEKEGKLYIVGIKSGPYWANADQLRKMKENFKKAKEILIAEGEKREIVSINGCVYGKENKYFDDGKDPALFYFKTCGQEFWSLITGSDSFYKDLIQPIEQTVKSNKKELEKLRAQKIHEFAQEFFERFCTDSLIDWDKLIV